MDAGANANANAGGSTIALRELCSGELIKGLEYINIEICEAKSLSWNIKYINQEHIFVHF